MKHVMKRPLALMLALCMCMSVLPLHSLAAESTAQAESSTVTADYLSKCTKYSTYMILEATSADDDIKTLPCSITTNLSSKDVRAMKKGETYTCLAIYKNTAGGYWYAVTATSDNKSGYIYGGTAKFKSFGGNAVLSDVTIATTTPKQGIGCAIKGSITTTSLGKVTINSATGVLKDAQGKSQTKTITSGFGDISKTALNNDLKFGQLCRGPGSLTITTKFSCQDTSGTTLTTQSGEIKQTINFTVQDTYKVIYDANGGTNAPASQTKTYGKNLTLTTSVPTRLDYAFQGWSTSKTATSATYKAGGTLKTDVYTGNITLYAVWKYSAHTHSYGAWTTTKEATCTETGTKIRSCTVSGCTNTETETIPATGHSMGAWKTIQEASCTEDGSKTRSCTNGGCSYTESATIPAKGHDYTDYVVEVDATCEDPGYNVHFCACGESYIEENVGRDPIGHDMSDWFYDGYGIDRRYCHYFFCDYEETRKSEIDENIVNFGKCGPNANWILTVDGTLTISGTGNMMDYSTDNFDEPDTPWYFNYTDLIKTVIIENGITSIGDYAFMDCSELTSVSIPGSVTRIGTASFLYCTKLSSINIPASVTSIEFEAFFMCHNLKSISIPAGVKQIGSRAFVGTGLQKITVDASNKYYSSDASGVLYNKSKTKLLQAPAKLSGTYYVPASVTWVDTHAFFKCSGLNSICFRGNAPGFQETVWLGAEGEDDEVFYCTFSGVTATAYYPAGNTTWTTDKLLNYGGKLTWAPFSTTELTAPTLTVTNVASTGKIKLTWNKVDGAAKYEVYRATSENGTYTKLYTSTGTSLTNTSTEAGKTYYYKVRALNAGGSQSDWSNVVARTCDLPQPKVTVSNVASSGKIKLTWQKVEGAKKYEIYRSTSKNGTYVKLSAITGTSVTNVNTTAGKTYYYKIKAIHSTSAANSAYSAVVSRTCDLAQPEVTLTNIASTGKIKISWEKVEGAAKYEVYRATSENGTYTKLTTVTGTSVTNTSTEAGKTYYYKVKAIHSTSAANSAYSAVVSRTCDLARPTAKVALNSSGKPVISWGKVEGAVKYTLYIYDANGNLLKTTTTTGLKLTHSSAVAGTTYKYQVVAVHSNSAANSAKSAAVSIKSN